MNEQTKLEFVEERTDTILAWVAKQKYSVFIIAVYSFFWYLVGYYFGDIMHMIANMF